MLTVRKVAVSVMALGVGIGVGSCGSARTTDAARIAAPSSFSTYTCEDLLKSDAETYSEVADSLLLTGDQLSEWYLARTAPPVDRRVDEAKSLGERQVALCLMQAPGYSPPHPPGAPEPDRDTQLAVVIVGLEEAPVLDSVGPAAPVRDVFEEAVKISVGVAPSESQAP